MLPGSNRDRATHAQFIPAERMWPDQLPEETNASKMADAQKIGSLSSVVACKLCLAVNCSELFCQKFC